MVVDPALLDWLLDADPALRWQVERDLAGAPQEVWEATRARIAREGFGARLLALQDPDGQWAGGAYFPGDFDFHGPEAAEDAGQPWTATTWTLNTLRDWGLDAAALAGTADLLAAQQSLGVRRPAVLGRRGRLLHQRLHPRQRRVARGGCLGNRAMVPRPPHGRRRLELRVGRGLDPLIVPFHAQRPEGVVVLRGRDRRLRRAARRPSSWREVLAGASAAAHPVDGRTRRTVGDGFAYPFRWFYSVLNAEHFRTAALHDGTAPDPRLADAIEVIRAAGRPDGTWLQEHRHQGGSGSRSTCRPASRPSGSRSTPCAYLHGGIGRPAQSQTRAPAPRATDAVPRQADPSTGATRRPNRQTIGSPFCSTRTGDQINPDGVTWNIGTPTPSHEPVSWWPWEESPIPRGTINLCLTS